MGLKDTLSEASMVLREWKNLPRRVDNSVMSRVTKKPMSDKLTPIDKKIRLPVFTTLMFSTALAACARISSELPNTASPVADNGPRTATAAPTNEALGVQFGEVAVWDKATLAAKDANVSAQIDALAGELRKQRPDLFVGNTQLESFAISVPAKDMTGKKTNTIYPFIVGNNQTDRNKSFVTIVLRRLDGQGIFAQSLTPVDIDVDGQQRGALVLPTSDTEQLPIFIFPKSLKDWNAQSDAQKVASDVIFIPPTGDRVKIPLSGGKLASPAVYNAQVGYATPGFSPDRIATASATDFYKTQTPTATVEAPKPTAQPIENKVGTIIFERKIELTSNDIEKIEKNTGNGNAKLGDISPNLDKDKKLAAAQLKVIPSRIYEIDGKYYCDCVLDRSLSKYKIEIGNILTSDGSITDKKLPGEFGMNSETYSNKLASIVITPDKALWPRNIEFNAENMMNRAFSGDLKSSELRIILGR